MLADNPNSILDGLNTAVLTFDDSLHLTSINPAGEMLFEISAKRATGLTVEALLPNSPDVFAGLQDAVRNLHPFTLRGLILRLPQGKRITVDAMVTPISDRAGLTELIVELTQVDRLLRLAQEDSILNRHAAGKEVLRGLAHEIKNPLGGLRGAAQLLERELPDRSLNEYTHIIIHEADRLQSLVDRMMGSAQPFKDEMVNIHRVLARVCTLIEAEFPHGLSVVTDYDPSAPRFRGDADQMIQAVLNLVRNAAEAMHGRGEIHLRTRMERQFTVGHARHRLVLRADIEDDGPGVPRELIDRVFMPMVTGRAEGTGLGLSIAQEIVNRHHGVITCDSRPGKTVFSIFLPLENGNDGS